MPWDEIERIRKEFERERWLYYLLGIITGVGLAPVFWFFRGC